MSQGALTARELARHLVARASSGDNTGERAVVAAQTACEHAYQALDRSLGATGSSALISRALVQAQGTHFFLNTIRVEQDPVRMFDDLRDSIDVHGPAAVAAGLEALLEALLGLLGRLIGDDMVARLVEHNPHPVSNDDEEPT